MSDASEKIPDRSALNPTVKKLGAVSFFADVSSEMLYPITPIFLTKVLGASVSSVGVIEGIAEGVASLLKTYSGVWSDRIERRKPFIWLGYLFAALAKPMIGFATGWPAVLAARSFDRLGKGIRSSPRDALLAEAVDPKFRGKAFGWHRMMDTLGAAIGPLLAILFLHFSPDIAKLRTLYFLALIPGLLAVATVFFVHEKPATVKKRENLASVPLAKLGRPFHTYLFAWGVFSLVNSSDVFLLLATQRVGFSLTHSIVLYTFYNLFYAAASPYFGGLSDTVDRKFVLIAGLCIFALVYVGFGFAHLGWEFWILFALYGLYMAATEGVGKAMAVDLVPAQMKASGVGLLGTVSGLATIFASVAAGQLWDRLGFQWTFFYGAAGAIVAALILMIVPKTKQPEHVTD